VGLVGIRSKFTKHKWVRPVPTCAISIYLLGTSGIDINRRGLSVLLLWLTIPIALIETIVLYQTMVWRNRETRFLPEINHTSLMRLTFASQLIIELLTGSKTVGGFASFGLGILAGFLSMQSINLATLSELLMNVFMGISMGIFLIGHLPFAIALLLITPVLLSSSMTLLHTHIQLRKR